MSRDPHIDDYFASDVEFDIQYPLHIRRLSAVHFTPLNVAAAAARFLASAGNERVLDAGAGVGKFCAAGAYFTEGFFHGVEQRDNFVRAGAKVIRKLQLERARLTLGNITDANFANYQGIYFYNSFHENLIEDGADDKVQRSPQLYAYYTDFFVSALEKMPAGTKLATYWLAISEVPGSFRLTEAMFDEKLKLWVKEH